MTKSRIFLYALLAFIAGVAVRSFVVLPLLLLWAAMLGAVSVIALVAFRRKKTTAVYGLFLLVFVIGASRFAYVEASRPDLSSLYGRPHSFVGIVVEEPERTEKVERFAVETEIEGIPFRALVTTRLYPRYAIGDELDITGVLEQPENYSDFDYVSYLARDGIFATIGFPEIEKVGEGKGSRVKYVLSRVKHAFEEKIEVVLPEPHAAFLKGLLLGERESLPSNLVEQFKITGTTHIVALSGYNITLIGRSLMNLFLWFTIWFQLSFWLALTAILLFVVMTGASASVVRAGIMGILVLVAQKEGRMYAATNALVCAAALMVFQNPFILRFDVAFQLSFLATLGLILLSPHVERLVNRFWREKRLPRVRSIFIETLSAQIMVLPLLVYLFGRVSLVSPLSNVLVLVAVPHAMGIGFFAGLAGFIADGAGRLVGAGAWFLLSYIMSVIDIFSRVPFASVAVPVGSAAFLAAGYIIILIFLWKRSAKMRR